MDVINEIGRDGSAATVPLTGLVPIWTLPEAHRHLWMPKISSAQFTPQAGTR